MMKNPTVTALRKSWNVEHADLRRLLEKNNMPKALTLFARHHAVLHSAKIGGGVSLQDETLLHLSDEQMRRQLPGAANSVVWMLWHITRIEDATVNVLLAGQSQVFHSGGWLKKTASPYMDVGNEMSPAEIRELSDNIKINALLSYRLAVGRRTQKVIHQLQVADWQAQPLPNRLEMLLTDGTVRTEAGWLLKYWGGHPKYNLLLMPATRHGFVHFNEIARMTPRLKKL